MTGAEPLHQTANPDPQSDAPRQPQWRQAGRQLGRQLHVTIHLAALLVLALVVFLPGFASLPVTDRDEGRFVQATKQMVETGNWVDIRLQDEPRYKKPIGIYWLQGASVVASGYGADAPIWVYRIPSLIGAVVAVLLTYAIGLTLGGTGVGLAAGLLALATVEIGIEARIGKTDGALLATIMAAQWALASLWMDPARRAAPVRNAVFWTALGLGILIKGPVILLVTLGTLAGLAVAERSTALVKALQPLRGVIWTLVLVLPWLIAIAYVSGGAFFQQSIGTDMLGKVVGAQESHGAPPGMHALVAYATFWPLAAFIPAAIAWGYANRRAKPVIFLAAWVIPGWLVFEAVPTKLPNYVLPFMPAFAVLAGLALISGGLAASSRWRRISFVWIAVAAVVLALGLNIAFVVVEGRASVAGLAGAVLASGIAVLAWRLAAQGRTWLAVVSAVVASAFLTATAFGVLMPGASKIWLSDRLAEAAADVAACPDPLAISIGYNEPSLVFQLGTDTALTSPLDGADSFHAAPCAVAFVDAEQSGAFLARLAELGGKPLPARLVEARNLNGFDLRMMQVFAKP